MSADTQLDFSHLLKGAESIEAFDKAVSRKRVSERFAEAKREAAVAAR